MERLAPDPDATSSIRVHHFVDGRRIAAGGGRTHLLAPQLSDGERRYVPLAGPEEIRSFVPLAGEGLARWLAAGSAARLRVTRSVQAAGSENTFRMAEALADDAGIPCELAVRALRGAENRLAEVLDQNRPSLLPLGLYVIVTGTGRAATGFVELVWPLLLSGSVVIVNPAPEAPRTMTLLAELSSSAGLFDGVFNVVHGDERTARALAAHPLVAGAIGIGLDARSAAVADVAGGLGKRSVSIHPSDEIAAP